MSKGVSPTSRGTKALHRSDARLCNVVGLDYRIEQRVLPRSVRILQIEQLLHVRFPLRRDAPFARIVRAVVSQTDKTAELGAQRAVEIFERLYRRGDAVDCASSDSAIESGGFYVVYGESGTGKSAAARSFSEDLRRLIHDAARDVFAIPAVLVETPLQGQKLGSLGRRIIWSLDRAFAEGNYLNLYVKAKASAGGETAFSDALRLLQIHRTRLLIVDQIPGVEDEQSGADADANGSPLGSAVSRLVVAARAVGISVLLVGDERLRRLTETSARPGDAAAAMGLEWPRLAASGSPSLNSSSTASEYQAFMKTLWVYQWTRTPFALTPDAEQLFHRFTGARPALIVRLFHSLQLHAIRGGGDEVINELTIEEVARNEFRSIEPEDA